MLTTLKNAFKIKEIRKKLLFTFLMLVVIRIGCQLPVPGVNRHFFSNWFAAQTGDTFSFFNAFTGGSFENMSLFALNITPRSYTHLRAHETDSYLVCRLLLSKKKKKIILSLIQISEPTSLGMI